MSVETEHIEHIDAAEIDADAPADTADESAAAPQADVVDEAEPPKEQQVRSRRFTPRRVVAFGLLPALALLLALAAGYLTWQDSLARQAHAAAADSVRAASESMVAILSYQPDTVDSQLVGAADRLTGSFQDQYTQLIKTVVAPGAKQQHISAVATVPAASSVSATANHAVVLVFVNQTTTIGDNPPTQSASSVRTTLEKVHGQWLISQFEPV